MSPFTDKEIEYLHGQRLGRLATVGSGGSPHIVPVGFRLDAEAHTIEIGGHGLSKSKKWRDLQANPRAAFASTTWPASTHGPPRDRNPGPRRTPRRRR
jgi:pyridoxamine 5'-phosphate oxidase family protein